MCDCIPMSSCTADGGQKYPYGTGVPNSIYTRGEIDSGDCRFTSDQMFRPSSEHCHAVRVIARALALWSATVVAVIDQMYSIVLHGLCAILLPPPQCHLGVCRNILMAAHELL